MSNQAVPVVQVKRSAVHHTYNGVHRACMCGCKGTHSYDPESNGPGYDVPRKAASVTRTVNLINDLLRDPTVLDEVEWTSEYVYVALNGRCHVAYFGD
jgi:hypothetical protein